jgi:hypothetical protein
MGSITPQNPAQSQQSSLNQLESGRQQIMSYLESHTRVSPPLSLDELENIVQNLQARYRLYRFAMNAHVNYTEIL